ncbi:hypothetical protein HYH03_014390 [Edaphochlamys debaryana]|uniref:Plant heme peroxidase family profile domain-containing protein n=1 Tax=Edaphochlamys debaryana TaxID=47281 RepID=A0A835XP21_9CHLO|nr:hypothetical protein HYH03_014390 [Edaphochlamys debaryana]|eukprot:KAG2487020.1 hypothetical protein HYH03_014390 [Edaphochlamys debaryana]
MRLTRQGGALLLLLPALASAGCPFGFDGADSAQNLLAEPVARRAALDVEAVRSLDIDAVKDDLKKLFRNSQDFWPADFGHYGPLMVRLAWHCTGSYRLSDGRGGCDGARQRFDPERSWDDNTNLDKARSLLWPIKAKYGKALTWGDLIVLAGTTAIEDMGGPVLGVCLGRIDDADGTDSLPLGPSKEQEAVAPCETQGSCQSPLGSTTIGLIYVNPEGPHGEPDPVRSAPQVRDSFARMGMNDAETVALVGGGHAFGKAHGACPTGPGPAPKDQPLDPWPGTCGAGPMKGKGDNTFTSGFEGPWTTNPTQWDNEYFKLLVDHEWESYISPGGHNQWRPVRKANGEELDAASNPSVMMLTTDVSLTKDPGFLKWVKIYAENQTALDEAFSHAWYKLMTRDVGPHSRCLGSQVPPPQPFQAPLPPPLKPLPDYKKVARDIARALNAPSKALPADTVGGKPYYGALFVHLAFQCAANYRQTDYSGGCNGARIRLAPQKDWPLNRGADSILKVLTPVRAAYPTLSYADLIVLAGGVALEEAGADHIAFVGGRSDAPSDEAPLPFQPPREFDDKILEARDNMQVMGLTAREWVALAGRPRSPSQQKRLGYSGSWTADPSVLDNSYFKVLLGHQWEAASSDAGQDEFRAAGADGVWMTPRDLAIRSDPEMMAIAQEFAADAKAFHASFVAAWSRLMAADRFDLDLPAVKGAEALQVAGSGDDGVTRHVADV